MAKSFIGWRSGLAAPVLANPGTRYAALSQTITPFTITNSSGAGTFSATGLPTGLSINATTGEISGTVDAGVTVTTHSVEIDCTNATGTSSVTFAYDIRSGFTEIDSLDTFPYYLNTANMLYVLTENITVDGTAFAAVANGVVLDLNGFTATYNNATPIAVDNFSFETGTGDTPDGWDLTTAPNAVRFAGTYLNNEVDIDSDYSLKFNDVTVAEYTDNNTDIVLEANTKYALSAMVEYGGSGRDVNAGVVMYVQLHGAGVPTIEASKNTTNERGMQLIFATFTTGGSPATYTPRVGVRPPTGLTAWTTGESVAKNVFRENAGKFYQADAAGTTGATPPTHTTGSVSDGGVSWTACIEPVYIDSVQVRRFNAYGVALSCPSFAASTFPDLSSYGNADSVVVCNGSITQGQDAGIECHAVPIHQGDDATITRTTLTVNGPDTHVIRLRSQTGATVSYNTLASLATTITSRDNVTGAIIGGPNVGGTFEYNIITHGCDGGINSNQTSTIRYNVIQLQAARYTNNFAIFCGGNGTQVYGNQVLCDTGSNSCRGLMIARNDLTHRDVYSNIIRTQCLPLNQEYGDSGGIPLGGSYGVQWEDAGDVDFYDNQVYVNAVPAPGYAMRTKDVFPGIRIYSNTFTIVAADNDSAVIRINGVTDANATISGNTYNTNCGIIGYSSGSQVTFDTCVIRAADIVGSARPWTTETATANNDITFLNCDLDAATLSHMQSDVFRNLTTNNIDASSSYTITP